MARPRSKSVETTPRNRDLLDHSGRGVEKCPTGIRGFDELTLGGLPRGRPTLVCGGTGCGKTILACEFLVRGAVEYGEPGVFVSFEESADDLRKNVASLGFNLDDLVAKKLLLVDHVRVERSEIEETGEYDLEGLFIRLGYAIDTVGARRVVLDTIESLFSGLSNSAVLRSELRRLFGWLKEKGVTAIITGERGEGSLTRQGLEEYVSDCVILLEHLVSSGVTTRKMRVVKYRGSVHGTNEYPFLIDEDGISVVPITSAGLRHVVSDERVSTGIPRLDDMLGGAGYYRGSSVLISGTAGSGKTSIAGAFAQATCAAREPCIYFSFEESESQILRNLRSIGIELAPAVRAGLLTFHSSRPTLHGLEMHLAIMHRMVEKLKASAVIIDPITNLIQSGSRDAVNAMLVRLLDFLKERRVTTLFTSLTGGGQAAEATEAGISSLMDTWLLLRNLEASGERNRGLYVLKSRGMAHSRQIREFLLTSQGIELVDVYTGPDGVLTGSARLAQEANEAAAEARRLAELGERESRFERRRAVLTAQIVALQAELEGESAELGRAQLAETERRVAAGRLRSELARSRGADGVPRGPVASVKKRNGRTEARS
jgi:circadian clock protein KaiC